MADENVEQISLDANVLEGTSEGLQITYQTEDGQTVTTIASSTEAADIVSKAFTTVADGTEANVEYITMTPEEAAAAGVVTAPEEEQQVVTTSLQFDPANPSVLYTADGTPINQADLTPEEQALVQAALQQHLAEQEAEQQLAMMQQGDAAQVQQDGQQTILQTADGTIVTSTSMENQQAVVTTTEASTDATVTSTGEPSFRAVNDGVDLASPNTSASQIVQTLADNVRKRELEEKMKMGFQAEALKAAVLGGEVNYSEKIVIRQGQPQVVKIPVKKKPEIPAALASLMPKVEIGKDGSQVIRIHQSQITSNQLKALQDNPNVRLVFRPASRPKTTSTGTPVSGKKRGRPRKNPMDPSAKIISDQNYEPDEPELEDPPAKTRCGRVSKRPVYTKDYLTPKVSREMDDLDNDAILDPGDEIFSPVTSNPLIEKRPRGRPPGKNNKRTSSYASKIEALQGREYNDPVPVQMKPPLTPIEQALSTRRKNRLRELLGACSEDEVMEVALPHLARVFSLWEFLVTKVEKNKMSRVFFADIYKEYECLHKYVSKLAEKYNEAIEEKKFTPETSEAEAIVTSKDDGDKKEGETSEAEEKQAAKVVQVTFAKLAESLGLQGSTLQEAEISLLDPEEAIGPRIMGMIGGGVRRGGVQSYKYNEDKSARKKEYTSALADVRTDTKLKNTMDAGKPIQTEATSTISTIASSKQSSSMPPLKPLGQTKVVTSETTANASAPVNGVVDGSAQSEQATNADTPMETETTATATTEATAVTTEAGATESTGTQLIQIGQGEDQQFIEVPEGYTLIQTSEGLVMSQPGTTISQGDDGVIYITHADGTTTPLNTAAQQGVPMETVETLLSLDGQQSQT